jgi:hypothetical protein
MTKDNIEIEVSFYSDCIICKGHYHDFTSLFESNAINLENGDFRINEMNVEEMNSNRIERRYPSLHSIWYPRTNVVSILFGIQLLNMMYRSDENEK